ncbi:MAG: glycosyltransferase [Candidatus Hydrogenedentes bacterium]|nr:glycosyltransferase [Candidatus Hydrogenedentota bacterium]
MKPLRGYQALFDAAPIHPQVQRITGRGGQITLQAGEVLLHSKYDPVREAERFVQDAALDKDRPVLVVGLGYGYHVAVLRELGFDVAVLEPNTTVARFALDGPLKDSDVDIALGAIDEIAADPDFQAFAQKQPQILIHPPTARVDPDFATAAQGAVGKAALSGKHLRIAVVGPMYGGSLPIAAYLCDAFNRLGHRTILVDNSAGWELYESMMRSVVNRHASNQLGNLQSNVLSEWTYARVAEFNPEICIVMAQAPVSASFPERLRKKGIVTAFWYVENWRHLPYWKEIAPLYDFFFHIQPGEFEAQLSAAGCRHHAFVQTACDPARHRPVELSSKEAPDYACDLSFAGAGYYNRVNLFKGLGDYKFKIWGVGWNDRLLDKHWMEGEKRFDSEVFMKIVAGSKINLNLHSSTSHDGVDSGCDAVNPRVFEIAAAGGFQLCDPCIGLEKLFDFDTELPVYHDLKSLRAQIDHYLAHPEERKRIAAAAQQRALREHTYECRAAEMLDHILEHYGAALLKRGIRAQYTLAETIERVGADSDLGKWLSTLPGELLFTHDTMRAFLRSAGEDLYPAEQIFKYMTEVRSFAETLLANRET